MGHVDEGNAQPLLEVLQFQLHGLPQFIIQGSQRFVQQQDLGIVHQGPGYGHPLLLPAAHLLGFPVPELFQLGQLEHFGHPFLLFLPGHFFHHQAEADILFHSHVGEEGIVLEHHVHIPLIGGQMGHVFIIQKNMARRRRFQTGDHAQHGGFPTAGRA